MADNLTRHTGSVNTAAAPTAHPATREIRLHRSGTILDACRTAPPPSRPPLPRPTRASTEGATRRPPRREHRGAVAQLEERCVRIAEVRGSNPLSSTSNNASLGLALGAGCQRFARASQSAAAFVTLRDRKRGRERAECAGHQAARGTALVGQWRQTPSNRAEWWPSGKGPEQAVADRLGISKPTVTKWRSRFVGRRLEGPVRFAQRHTRTYCRPGRRRRSEIGQDQTTFSSGRSLACWKRSTASGATSTGGCLPRNRSRTTSPTAGP
jgi:hypothetical protein